MQGMPGGMQVGQPHPGAPHGGPQHPSPLHQGPPRHALNPNMNNMMYQQPPAYMQQPNLGQPGQMDQYPGMNPNTMPQTMP